MSLPTPPKYLSRHEVFKVKSGGTSLEDTMSAAEVESNSSSTGSQYLQEVLGDVLADALSKVAKERPMDPIQYVADYLHGLKQPHFAQEPSKTLEPPKSPSPEPPKSPSPDPPQISSPEPPPKSLDPETGQSLEEDFGLQDPDVTNGLQQNGESKSRPSSSAVRRRTAQSEPPPSLGNGSLSTSNPGTSSSVDSSNFADELNSSNENSPQGRLQKFRLRTQSLDRKTGKTKKSRKSLKFSKHLPAVAMSKDEYRARRGLLPPMSESPKSSAEELEPRISPKVSYSRYANSVKAKPRQLAPLDEPNTFNMEKHNRRNKKLSEMANKR